MQFSNDSPAIVIVFMLAILRLLAFLLRRFLFWGQFIMSHYQELRSLAFGTLWNPSSWNFHVSHANNQFRFSRGKNYT